MKGQGLLTGFSLFGSALLQAAVADDNQGKLDTTSTGYINFSLEISDDIAAGFPGASQAGSNPVFVEMLSSRLVQTIRQGDEPVLPLCVISSGRGYFEVTLVEMTGREASDTPYMISLGEDKGDSVKYQAVNDECSLGSSIPVTIHLNRQYTGEEVGTIYGRFNLLVKSE